MSIRERLLPCQQWWADIGHVHTPDWDGNMYDRTFAEEGSSFAIPLFSPTKTTADLLRHLDFITEWVPRHVPGGKFAILRMDFGSEASRQGHGEDFIVQALKVWMRTRPYFRFVPVAPPCKRVLQSRGSHPATRGTCRRQCNPRTPRCSSLEPHGTRRSLSAQLPPPVASRRRARPSDITNRDAHRRPP